MVTVTTHPYFFRNISLNFFEIHTLSLIFYQIYSLFLTKCIPYPLFFSLNFMTYPLHILSLILILQIYRLSLIFSSNLSPIFYFKFIPYPLFFLQIDPVSLIFSKFIHCPLFFSSYSLYIFYSYLFHFHP